MRDYAPVAHTCGTRDCIEKSHLRVVTQFMNSIESTLRANIVKRITALEDVIRELDAEHPTLTAFPPLGEPPGLRSPR